MAGTALLLLTDFVAGLPRVLLVQRQQRVLQTVQLPGSQHDVADLNTKRQIMINN